MGSEVPHIELRRWADILVFAPLDANTLAKLNHGLCDNIVTCVARVRCSFFRVVLVNVSQFEENISWLMRDLTGMGFLQADLRMPSHEHVHVGSPNHIYSGLALALLIRRAPN
jgi:hypothetical protein